MLSSAFGAHGDVHWYVIESNSSGQGTLLALEKLKKRVKNFSFLTLGHDPAGFRTERIARSRNAYLSLVLAKTKGLDLDSHLLVVADLDGINKKVRVSASSLQQVSQGRAAIFPVQIGPYYDISALRHHSWNPNHPWLMFADLQGVVGPSNAFHLAISSKQIRLKGLSKKIEVQSAFGGLGVYPLKEVFESKAHYLGIDADGGELCEHVPFNNALSKFGVKLFLDPKFTNATFTEHTRNLHPIVGPMLRLRHWLAELLPAPLRIQLGRFLSK